MDDWTRSVELLLQELYIAAPGAGLRKEERLKARQVASLLEEIDRAARSLSRSAPLVLVDAAAGKSYVGLIAAKLVLEPLGRPARVVSIEHDPRRMALCRSALGRLDTTVPVECRTADVGAPEAWPRQPSIVTGLHACGAAADAIIEQAILSEARVLLLVPCCTSRALAAARRAGQKPAFSRHAAIRRRYVQAMVDAERTWRLEAAGYQTEVVEFVPATVTPHNLLWRSRRVLEPARMARAREILSALVTETAVPAPAGEDR